MQVIAYGKFAQKKFQWFVLLPKGLIPAYDLGSTSGLRVRKCELELLAEL